MSRLINAYALIIGIKYSFDDLDTTEDAKALANVLRDETICGYPEENVTLLIGEQADRKGILGAFNALISKTNESSSVFLFYSGHGDVYKDTFHFVPAGIKADMNADDYMAEWVTAEEIRKKINQLQTRRLIFFLDCCHSTGIASETFRPGSEVVKKKKQKTTKSDSEEFTQADGLAQKVDTERGISVVASCKENQKSYKLDADRNSLFTKHLLLALMGQHQTHFVDPYVRILQVASYLLGVIPPILKTIADKWDKPEFVQEPYANLELYDDFVLSYVPKDVRAKLTLPDPDEAPSQNAKGKKEVKTIFRETPGANNLLLFIHGFSGEAGDTFGNIPDMLMQDSRMDGWDMKPFGYSQFVTPEMGKDIWAGIGDIDRISDYLCTSVKYKFDKYDRIAIVAHSLGGLIAQRAILGFKDEYRNKLSHVVLLGTPSNGIEPAKLKKLWNSKYEEMSSEGHFITSLRQDWKDHFKNDYPFILKVLASIDDEFVTLDSCYAPFAKEHRVTIDGKHLSMVKPKNENDDCYALIMSALTNSEFHNQYTNNEEINIALGKYDAVVKQLLPRKDELDANGLKRLIFGLEGLDRREEALQILNEHPKAQEDTDLMGIIGGRYKRAYLKFPSESAGDAAFVYYELALEKSTSKGNYGQIYYHAINLAFLSIVVANDEQKMLSYAKIALDATEECKDDPWKNATIAEANLYLRNFEKAKKFYLKAADGAGIREKISMHLNAYAGYTELMQTNKPEDDFIVFLKDQFLS